MSKKEVRKQPKVLGLEQGKKERPASPLVSLLEMPVEEMNTYFKSKGKKGIRR